MPDVYDAADSYVQSIKHYGDQLCGDVVAEPAAESWHDVAATMARELRRYADFLDLCVAGRAKGPFVFPSWRD